MMRLDGTEDEITLRISVANIFQWNSFPQKLYYWNEVYFRSIVLMSQTIEMKNNYFYYIKIVVV